MHWTKIVKKIEKKYNVDWETAKQIYKKNKSKFKGGALPGWAKIALPMLPGIGAVGALLARAMI